MTPSNKFTVLIIDDEPEIVELVAYEFSLLGHAVVTAYSGKDAISVLNSHKVDIVLSDFRMPEGTGLDVLDHVNKMNKAPRFYFFSGQSDLSVNECLKLGALNFYVKPNNIEQMVFDILNFKN